MFKYDNCNSPSGEEVMEYFVNGRGLLMKYGQIFYLTECVCLKGKIKSFSHKYFLAAGENVLNLWNDFKVKLDNNEDILQNENL